MSSILCTYIEPNLISGSSEILRYLVGGYYEPVLEESTGPGNEFLYFVLVNEYEQSIGEYGDSVTEISAAPITKVISSYKRVSSSYSTYTIPKYTIPIRIFGNPDVIDSDQAWAAFFRRASDSASNQLSVTTTRYEDHSFTLAMPYTQYNANVLASKYQTCNAVEISYDYNIYLPRFDEYVNRANIKPEQYPNYYFLWFINSGVEIDDNIKQFIDREGAIEQGDMEKILSEVVTDIVPPTVESADNSAETNYLDRSYNLREYLTSSMLINPVSASTVNYVQARLDSIIFDTDAYLDSLKVSTFYNDLFPYYAKINFPWSIHDTINPSTDPSGEKDPDSSSNILDLIRENDYEQLFLKYLKEIFSLDLAPQQVRPIADNYIKYSTYLSASESSDVVNVQADSKQTTLRSYSLIDLFGYSYNNFSNDGAKNYCFMGQKTLKRFAASPFYSRSYRHLSTSTTLKTMKAFIDKLINASHPMRTVSEINSIADLYSFANDKYTEVVAYRIKKIDGPSSNPLNAPSMQDFWFPRISPSAMGTTLEKDYGSAGEMFSFIDSQIDLNRDYTYAVYAYAIVLGVRYRLSDIRYTEQIGTTSTGDYCLQFTDGFEPASQIYSAVGTNIASEQVILDASGIPIGGSTFTTEGNELLDIGGNEFVGEYFAQIGFATVLYYEVDDVGNTMTDRPLTPIVSYNRYVTDAQITSQDPYLADMYLQFEPTARIVEIPMTSKTISVQDYIPSNLEIEPSYELNDSQNIVFKLNYQPYVSTKFPYPIEPRDQLYKEKYISSNNLLQDQTLNVGTRSPPLIMDVYRLKERPRKMSDFTGQLHKQINLTMHSDLLSHNNTFTLSVFNDKIKTNHKYYYLFRVLSRNGHAGYSSEIYEAELRSDGGYKYAIFNTIEQDGLDPDRPKFTHSRNVKKLMQFKPAASHLLLDTGDVDYSQKALNQIENLNIGESTLDDPIWGKTFKIRLTSKKTGKKIDLNISYELQSD